MIGNNTDLVSYRSFMNLVERVEKLEKILKHQNEASKVSDNEAKKEFCSYCGKRKKSKGDGTIELLCECD